MLFANRVLLAEKVEWTSFYEKRIRRIVPAYFSACAIALMVAAFYSWPLNEDFFDISPKLPALLSFGLLPLPTINGFNFGRLLGVNWSLAIEWRYYAALPFLFILLKKTRVWGALFLVVFAVSDAWLTHSCSWVYFITGALCARLMYRREAESIRWAACAGMLVAVALYATYWSEFVDYGFERWMLMTALFVCAVVGRPGFLAGKTFVAMGSVSYSFYLLHSMVLFLLVYACHTYVVDVTTLTVKAFTLLAGGCLAVATLASTLSYLWVERPFHAPARKKAAMERRPRSRCTQPLMYRFSRAARTTSPARTTPTN